MEVQTWLISQLLIDAILLAIIAFMLKSRLAKREISQQEGEMDGISTLLEEMRSLGGDLEKNLEQKKKLTEALMGELEKRLEQAEEIAERLDRLLEVYKTEDRLKEAKQRAMAETRRTIQALLAEGLSREQISKRLSIPLGEVDLILKLHSPTSSSLKLVGGSR